MSERGGTHTERNGDENEKSEGCERDSVLRFAADGYLIAFQTGHSPQPDLACRERAGGLVNVYRRANPSGPK